MSVGKDSILRAANADAKKTEVKPETKPVEAAETKTETAKAPVKRAAAKKTTTAKKTTAAKKPTARKKTVKTSVLTPQNTEELEAVFVTGSQPEETEGPVRINEELPVYLL